MQKYIDVNDVNDVNDDMKRNAVELA